MPAFLQDLLRTEYRSHEWINPEKWGKFTTRFMKRMFELPGLHFAELPTRPEVTTAPNLDLAIKKCLSGEYKHTEKLQITEPEKWLFKETLKLKGYQEDQYDIELWKMERRHVNLGLEEKVAIISKANRSNCILFFDRAHLDFTGTEQLERNGSSNTVRYYFGPSDIVVHNGKDTAFNFGSLPSWSQPRIALNEFVAHLDKVPLKDLELSIDGVLNKIYMLPVIASPSYKSRLSGIEESLLNIPLVVLAHELGHANQTNFFRAIMYPEDIERRESNATYFAFRLVRMLRDHKIDIASGIDNAELIRIMEHSIFTHGRNVTRLQNRTKLTAQS